MWLQIPGYVQTSMLLRRKKGYELFVPPLKLCGDNGAMIGAQAYYEYLSGVTAGSDLNAYATMDI